MSDRQHPEPNPGPPWWVALVFGIPLLFVVFLCFCGNDHAGEAIGRFIGDSIGEAIGKAALLVIAAVIIAPFAIAWYALKDWLAFKRLLRRPRQPD